MNTEDVLGLTMKVEPSAMTLFYKHIIHGDISQTGMFLGKIRNRSETVPRTPFTEEEASRSSTYREIMVFWKFCL